MFSAKLEEMRVITLNGLKPRWKIASDKDTKWVDNQAFVRVQPFNQGLISLIFAKNDKVTHSNPKTSIVNSPGLLALIALRNKAQADSLSSSSDGRPQNTLFDDVNESPQAKKARATNPRNKQSELRDCPESICITVTCGDEDKVIEFLRPIHPTDNLFVAYRNEDVTTLLNFIRSKGVEDTEPRQRNKLPKGISTRKKGGYIVTYTKTDKSKGYKLFKDLEAAMSFNLEIEDAQGEATNAEFDDAVSEGEATDAENCDAVGEGEATHAEVHDAVGEGEATHAEVDDAMSEGEATHVEVDKASNTCSS